MAKKIRLDFSKVEDRSAWNSRQMPEGLYEAKIVLVDDKDASDGGSMRTYGLQPTQKKYRSRLFPWYCKLQANQLWKLRDLFIASGNEVPKKNVQLDPELPVGAIIAIEIADGTGQYSDRSQVESVYSVKVLEDLMDDDEEDGDYEDEEDADEEYDDSEDDEEEDDEDDSDEEYEDDDEDLDEDEDDDEYDDEDDDEEEEEPAPKRAPARKAVSKKPAAKSAAKAPAKKSTAAPAKRVVKRRR